MALYTLHTCILYLRPICMSGAERRIRWVCRFWDAQSLWISCGWSWYCSIMWKVKGSHEIWKEVGWTAPGIWGVHQ
jgi:hypothetical protein